MSLKLTPQQQATVTEARGQARSLVILSQNLVRAVQKHGVGSDEVKLESGKAKAVLELLLGVTKELASTENPQAAENAVNEAVHQPLSDTIANLKKAKLKSGAGDAAPNVGPLDRLCDDVAELRSELDERAMDAWQELQAASRLP